MIFEKDTDVPHKQTPVEWLVGYLKRFNCIDNTLSTRKAIEKALKMERDKFYLHGVISSVCICSVEKRRQFELDMNQCRYCEKQFKQTDL